MEGQTLEITILLEGLMSLRICINWLLIVMIWVDSKSESSIFLLERKIQKRLFEMRETKAIFLGDIIFPMAIMYSLWGIPSIELNTSAC